MFQLSSASRFRFPLLAGIGGLTFAIGTLPALAEVTDTETIIATGTRVTGLTAADSLAPISIIGAATLDHVGQPNLIQALAQISPSFSAEARGGDTSALMLRRLFIDHPRARNEGYFQHMGIALSFFAAMARGALGCLVHAIVPGLCVTTGSRTVRVLHDRMVVNRARPEHPRIARFVYNRGVAAFRPAAR